MEGNNHKMEEAQDDDEIFVYMGGDERVPNGVRRARIHEDVKIIPARAFQHRSHLVSAEFHDDIEIIEVGAFCGCWSLRSVKLLGVKIVRASVFKHCTGLTDVEFGNKLEIIENHAFYDCTALRIITIPSARTIGRWAFCYCEQLTDLDLPEGLETLEEGAFCNCRRLKRIAVPLKSEMIENNVCYGCSNLTTVDLVGGIHKTVASLHLEQWRNYMKDGIDRINRTLSNTEHYSKTGAIRSLTHRLDYYKAKHNELLKEATTLLDLVLWKANLDDYEGGKREGVRTTRRQRKRTRKEIRVTSGASIVIKNFFNRSTYHLFGDKLETIERHAFDYCISLTDITMLLVRTIGPGAFMDCYELTDLQLPEGSETQQRGTFKCSRLRRIAMPLKSEMIGNGAFENCPQLVTVNLVGDIYRQYGCLVASGELEK
eukprot:scaffold4862_cov133-Skeletonema_menzelii.AAC.7